MIFLGLPTMKKGNFNCKKLQKSLSGHSIYEKANLKWTISKMFFLGISDHEKRLL